MLHTLTLDITFNLTRMNIHTYVHVGTFCPHKSYILKHGFTQTHNYHSKLKVHKQLYTQKHIHTQEHMHTSMYVHTHTCTHTHKHTRMNTSMYTLTYIILVYVCSSRMVHLILCISTGMDIAIPLFITLILIGVMALVTGLILCIVFHLKRKSE